MAVLSYSYLNGVIAIKLLVQSHNITFLHPELASNRLLKGLDDFDFEVQGGLVDNTVWRSHNQELAHVFDESAIKNSVADFPLFPSIQIIFLMSIRFFLKKWLLEVSFVWLHE